MATNKTIQPSGETIVIPDFDEKPDARIIIQDISKLADNDILLNGSTAKEYATMWGKTVTAEVHAGFAVLYVNHSYEVRIWLAGTNEIDIAVQYIANNSTTLVTYSKTGNDSITFGENSTASRFTITRNGNSITVSTEISSTIKIIT